jgi:7-keto-8-aminopelargonate synthetase and related enzymes
MSGKFYDQLTTIVQSSINLGIGHLTTDANGFAGNSFVARGKKLINFALCDYLALGHDDRLKKGAIKAILDHGFFASVSKVYVKLDIYEKAEEYLSYVFDKPTLLFPRTTLAHMGVLPVLADKDDAVILDHHVHTSVRVASDLLKSYGVHVETIRHNRMDILEDRIKDLKNKYTHVWYLADGIYSTYGDNLPINDIRRLLNDYEQFHVYIDDSHGMSWAGTNGKGFINENMGSHPHMILSTSLCKGYGAEGGVIVCNDEDVKKKLGTCAAPLIFTSPISPSTLGAIIESAKIHLSSEIDIRQAELKERIDLFNTTSQQLELPLISAPNTPIGFFFTGATDLSQELCANLMRRGYYVNAFHFPAVPVNSSGVRSLVSLYQSLDDITGLLTTLREEYDIALKKRGMTMAEVLPRHREIKRLEEELLS